MKSICYLIILLLGSAAACKKAEDDCIKSQVAPFYSVDLPDTARINEDVIIRTIYTHHDGCGRRGDVRLVRRGDSLHYQATVKVEECSACTMATISFEHTIHFRASKPGTYYLFFERPGGNDIMETIEVR